MQASYDDGITKPPRYDRWPIVSTSQMYFPVGWPRGNFEFSEAVEAAEQQLSQASVVAEPECPLDLREIAELINS